MFSKTLMTIFFLLVFQLAHAQDLTSYAEKTDELFNKYITKTKPGGAVVVVKDGQIVHKNTFGMADFENQVPITTSTVFDIASVSKQFVGYAIAKLEQEGRLSLDDDVRTYISEFPDLNIGIHLAVFNDIGTIPDLKDRLLKRKEPEFT